MNILPPVKDLTLSFLGQNPRPTFFYFPTPLKSLPRPAEVLQSPTPGRGLGEAREGLRRLLLERAWGRPAKGGGDYSWRKSGEAREGSRRLLLERAWGKPAEGAAASLGDIAGKLTAKNGTQPQPMKCCIFPRFFHILAKSPGVPPTVSNCRQRHPHQDICIIV